MPAVEAAAPPASAPAVAAPSNPAMANAFSILDGMDHEGSGPKPEPKQEDKKTEAPKAADKSGGKEADKPIGEKPDELGDEVADANKPPEQKTDTTKPSEKPGDKPPEKPAEGQTRPSLGRLYRDEQKKTEELTRKLGVLEAELTKAKTAPPTPADDPEKKQLSARLQELEDHIRFVDYTKSKEYLHQYQKPYEETASNAVARATQLKITNEDGTKRNLTPDEFWQIVHIGDEDDAIAAAEKLFGEGSTKTAAVIERRNEIIKAHNAAEAAKEKYKKEGVERSKRAQEQWEAQQRQATEQATARAARFKELTEAGEKHEKMRDVFVAAEGDAEGAELLAKYRHETDRAFAGGAPLKDGEEPWTPDQLLTKHSVIRNRAGAFPYTVRQLRNAVKKIAELEAKIAGYQKSEPGAGEVKGDEKPPEGGGNPLQAALDKLDKLQ